MCNLTLYTSSQWTSISPQDGDYYDIWYRNQEDLLDFRLEKITAEVHDKRMFLTLTLHLAAQPDYHIVNSLLPSALMFLISYLSVFFPIVCFNERVMVSMTSLLVLVTLFSQATNTYVKTPYYKLIDVWYVVLIVLCFAVVSANALVNGLRVTRVKSQTDLMKSVSAAKRCNTVCQVLLGTCFAALIVTYALFSQDIL